MSDIQRYICYGYDQPEPAEVGDWVSYEDHLKAIEELKAEINDIRSYYNYELEQNSKLKAEVERHRKNLKYLIPDFLYRNGDCLLIGCHGDTEVSIEWLAYVESVLESGKPPQPPSEDL